FAQMIQEAGFQRVEYENLLSGVVAIHSGLKLSICCFLMNSIIGSYLREVCARAVAFFLET
ncbi:hypothetical protein ACJX0J_008083, partial [Zea mays]